MSMTGMKIKSEIVFRHLPGQIGICTFPSLDVFPGLTHFVTQRGENHPGDPFSSFNLGRHSGEDLTRVMRNRAALCRALSIPSSALVQPRQVHGNEVLSIPPDFLSWKDTEQMEYVSPADGLVTDLPRVCLAVSTADCVPLLFYDSRRRVIGASHAGWRGTVGHIALRTVEVMQGIYGSNPENIYVAIGPSIGESAFEVGDEVADAFATAYPVHRRKIISPRRGDNGRHHIDLWVANYADLLSAGIRDEHISVAGICTYTRNDLFFSSRRAGGKLFGRFLSGIFLH